MRCKITKTTVDRLEVGQILSDTEIKGFVARRLKSGAVTYGLRYRKGGQQRWLALGLHGRVTPQEARKAAKRRAGEVASDRDPVGEQEAARRKTDASVNARLDVYLERHVRRSLRSAKEVERAFNKYVRPRIGSKSINQLRRGDITEMLDAIADENGPVMADRTLAYMRKFFNWLAARDDDFNPPIVPGMARTIPVDRARDRTLDDQEVRDMWTALDGLKVPRPFAGLVRMLLLTAQRREKVAKMRWEQIEDNVWSIPADGGKKDGQMVPLTGMMREVLGCPGIQGFVFSTKNGAKAFSSFSKAKRELDQAIAEVRQREGRKPMPPWQLHDLRRTARSLMSRAGVTPDIAERVLGHAIPGIRGVYDRHDYYAEKKEALERLTSIVKGILRPQ